MSAHFIVCVSQSTVPDSTTVTRRAHMTMLSRVWNVSWLYIQVKYMVEHEQWTFEPLTLTVCEGFTFYCTLFDILMVFSLRLRSSHLRHRFDRFHFRAVDRVLYWKTVLKAACLLFMFSIKNCSFYLLSAALGMFWKWVIIRNVNLHSWPITGVLCY